MSRKCTSELRVRLMDADYALIQNNAARCGLTISDFVRKLLREEPLIQKPRQDAIEHFRALQMFRTEMEDVNGQEIGMDELAAEDTIQVSMGEDAAAKAILLMPDESRDFC